MGDGESFALASVCVTKTAKARTEMRWARSWSERGDSEVSPFLRRFVYRRHLARRNNQ